MMLVGWTAMLSRFPKQVSFLTVRRYFEPKSFISSTNPFLFDFVPFILFFFGKKLPSLLYIPGPNGYPTVGKYVLESLKS